MLLAYIIHKIYSIQRRMHPEILILSPWSLKTIKNSVSPNSLNHFTPLQMWWESHELQYDTRKKRLSCNDKKNSWPNQ